MNSLAKRQSATLSTTVTQKALQALTKPYVDLQIALAESDAVGRTRMVRADLIVKYELLKRK